MPFTGRVGLWALIVGTVTCAGDPIPAPPPDFTHAGAWPECGPADGPAVVIYLAREPLVAPSPRPPFVAISLWRSLDQLTERSWVLADASADGTAAFCSATDDCEAISQGEVSVTGVGSDSTITGSAVLTFPDAGRVTGGFSAEWLPRRFFVASRLCG